MSDYPHLGLASFLFISVYVCITVIVTRSLSWKNNNSAVFFQSQPTNIEQNLELLTVLKNKNDSFTPFLTAISSTGQDWLVVELKSGLEAFGLFLLRKKLFIIILQYLQKPDRHTVKFRIITGPSKRFCDVNGRQSDLRSCYCTTCAVHRFYDWEPDKAFWLENICIWSVCLLLQGILKTLFTVWAAITFPTSNQIQWGLLR